MLDQPILSFKNMNSTGSSNEGATTAAASGGESDIASRAGMGNNGEGTETNHKFAEVLKETQTKIQKDGVNSKEKSASLNASEIVKVELSNEMNFSAAIMINTDVDLDNLKDKLAINSELKLDLTTVGTLEGLPTISPDVNIEGLDDAIEGAAAVSALTITAISPLDADVAENRLSEKFFSKAKPLLQTITTPLSDGEQMISIAKITPTTAGLSLQSTSTVLINAANKGQFVQQLDNIVVDPLVNVEESSFDADILKSLGLNTQAAINLQSSQSSQAALSSTSNTQLAVTIPFQQAQWGTAVAEKVMWLNSHGLQEAEIQLDPPELGPLQVKVTVENDQAHVSFVVQHSNVKEALEQTAARLREMFEAEGIDLVDVDVSDQSAEQQQEGESSDSLPEGSELADNPSQEQADSVTTSYIHSNNGIDAYV